MNIQAKSDNKMDTQQGKVSTEQKQHIFLIGLDRVEKRNAFDSFMIEALAQALTDYENNPQLRCAVIFAHGEHFTAGLDLFQLQPFLQSGQSLFPQDKINPWGTSGRHRTKPVIVAVQGTCFTAGIELMLNADIAIAADNSHFAQMEVQRGILPFGGATARFVETAGWSNAMRYILTGDSFDAETALKMNLITEICSTEQLFARAIALAQTISHAAPLAVQASLAAAHEAFDLGVTQALARLPQHLEPLLKSQDAIEGVLAMQQKRKPQFKGQ